MYKTLKKALKKLIEHEEVVISVKGEMFWRINYDGAVKRYTILKYRLGEDKSKKYFTNLKNAYKLMRRAAIKGYYVK